MQPDADLVVLATVPHEIEAQLIVDALKERGITAHQTGGTVSDFRVGVPEEVVIYVRPEDRDRALVAYAEARESAEEIDWSQVSADEPES
ncbi:MAG: hypothetical protein KF861_16425 [Planctomycetaceae bacterium]|nr:hypothetical protein [Planctomycetaceae bacterium]